MQQNTDSIESLKEETRQLVGHQLPKETFYDFTHPNNRMLVAVTSLRAGYADVAYKLFQTIAEEGPKENANHHFAYVRSLIEMAEMDAQAGRFSQAETLMEQALEAYPESMGYMMSRVHLEVYLAYYKFYAGKKEEAMKQIESICKREQQKFEALPEHDAKSLIGPGLCYAIHQYALFYAVDGAWIQAVNKMKEMLPYAPAIDPAAVQEAERLLAGEKAEEAFNRYTEAICYNDA
ncbi:hypothetical protein ACFO25_04230 [Paenactinomyces guangxiensis]|uniref:Tetratricopeptide repeat protein n=1 Tax=Paenactinomyces guangxiensis TaxID=1490290 RepID=A0A7W1WPM4_9BACL|nr:hypothetical protein [Paenactinomyces guangxiensis]MBA4493586.1 hypothetical protein [Paenactinomyces guangxiensis]MBH8590873.1 hypothetical protein [Paenactinomyces guangxiensis]